MGFGTSTYGRRVRCWCLAGNYTGWLKQKASEMELRDNKEKKLQARAQSRYRCGRDKASPSADAVEASLGADVAGSPQSP